MTLADEAKARENRRQDELAHVLPGGPRKRGELQGRRPPEPDGGEHNDDGRFPEPGHRQSKDRQATCRIILDGVLSDGRQDPNGQGPTEPEGNGHSPELSANRQPAGDLF